MIGKRSKGKINILNACEINDTEKTICNTHSDKYIPGNGKKKKLFITLIKKTR